MPRFVFCFAVTAIGHLLAQDAQLAKMEAIDRALGVGCAHCHTSEDWKRGDKPEFSMAGRMIKMTDGLSAGTLRNLGGVTCWTCHRGSVKPVRMLHASWEDRLAHWPEALKLGAEDAKKSRREVYKNIQATREDSAGSLPMAMSIFAGALGVGCDYCHVLGRWDSDEKPAKVTARLMLRMFDEIPHYFEEGHQPVMQCYTCHQGSPKPEREPKG
jgi:hypothetical protein